MSQEAIEKTIREIRDLVGKYGVKSFGPIIYTRGDLADRIEADVADILAENARLKAALKPVLDAYISQDDPSVDVYDGRLDAAVCVRAVRDAKRIYKGGAK